MLTIAYTVLFSWPIVVIALFRNLTLPLAVTWSVVAGYLLLPTLVKVDFPLLPTLDKTLIPSLAALLMAAYMLKTENATRSANSVVQNAHILPGWLPRSTLARVLLAMVIGGTFLTILTNRDSIAYGPTVLRGLAPYDAFSAVMNLVPLLLPFILARKFLAHPDEHKILLTALCYAGLGYSLLALFEIRMSPQLNQTIYGYFQHAWIQHVRQSGFRPIVFLQHGLMLGIFMSGTVLATIALWRTAETSNRLFFVGAALWLIITLVLAKVLGALLITLALVPPILFLGVRAQLIVASVIVMTVIFFPVLRSTGYIPVATAISIAEDIDIRRAISLRTRLENEELMLEKANDRPVFGWGGWNRARVFDETGTDITIADGLWIITLGTSGWVGYIGKFGLFSLSILFLTMRHRRYEISLVTSCLCLVLAANLLDLIPNSGLSPVTWLMAGALMGRVELGKIPIGDEADPERVEVVNASLYSRGRPAKVAEPQMATVQTPEKREARSRYTRQTKLHHRTDKAES